MNLIALQQAIGRTPAELSASLSIKTLRHRLPALSRWHTDRCFSDPTKSPLIRQIL